MDVLPMDLEIAEHGSVELPEHFVVISGHENHLGAALRLPQDGSDHVVVRLGPEHALFHAPDVDDVPDQEQRLHLDVVQEIEQQIGAAALEPQVHVRNKDRSQLEGRRRVTLDHDASSRSHRTPGCQIRGFV
jgi:hypothetical protein